MSEDRLIGQVIAERYRVDALVGEGAMGRVYRGEHVLMKKRVAIKFMHRELSAVPEVVERFQREALAAAHIEHPHVASCTDFGTLSDGTVFLVLEYVEGRPLSALIEAGPLRLERALEIALQIASALESAHALGIVHRDIKPDNVLLVEREGGRDFVKVLDFGIAKVGATAADDGKRITQVGMVYGTPEYMAPEQALGQEVDARADIYALGVILYEMLSGQRPYGGPVTGLLGQQLSTPLPLIKDRSGVVVPPGVEAFVRQMLVTDVGTRIRSSREVIERLELLLQVAGGDSSRRRMLSSHLDEQSIASKPRSVATPKAPSRPQRRRSGGRLWLALLLGLGGAAAAVFGLTTYLEQHSGEVAVAPAPVAPAPLPAPVVDIDKETEVARTAGLEALVALAEKYPAEGAVLAVLSVELAKTEKYDEAVEAARKALELDPRLNANKSIRGALFRSAQSGKATAAAFRLLEGPMGNEGVNIIYDISVDPNVKAKIRAQAERALRRPNVRAAASPSLLWLVELAEALDANCAAVRSVVERAALSADFRALEPLKALRSRVGCGPKEKSDCYLCLREGNVLEFAIETIEKRAPLPDGESLPAATSP